MNSSDITTNQAVVMLATIQRQLRYLRRLRDRMEKVGFVPNEPLYRDVSRAHDAVHALSVSMHYLSVKSGVGQPQS